MNKLIMSVVVALGVLVSGLSADELNCSGMIIKSDGTKQCKYKSNYSSSYAERNYMQSEQVKFDKYNNNCTNFVSQSVMAGFAKTTSMNSLFNVRKQYMADEGDTYSWFYNSKWNTGDNWKEAHSLYLYAKYTSDYDIGPNYEENGPKFKFIVRDSQTRYMYNDNDPKLTYNDIKVGDIIFADYQNLDMGMVIDGHMDHVFIVTDIKYWGERL